VPIPHQGNLRQLSCPILFGWQEACFTEKTAYPDDEAMKAKPDSANKYGGEMPYVTRQLENQVFSRCRLVYFCVLFAFASGFLDGIGVVSFESNDHRCLIG
jgi:hypothetical protein